MTNKALIALTVILSALLMIWAAQHERRADKHIRALEDRQRADLLSMQLKDIERNERFLLREAGRKE